jgi:hypothetical protein
MTPINCPGARTAMYAEWTSKTVPMTQITHIVTITVSRKCGEKVWIGFVYLRTGTNGRLFEYDKETSGHTAS